MIFRKERTIKVEHVYIFKGGCSKNIFAIRNEAQSMTFFSNSFGSFWAKFLRMIHVNSSVMNNKIVDF